jgi:hypothetical protein
LNLAFEGSEQLLFAAELLVSFVMQSKTSGLTPERPMVCISG